MISTVIKFLKALVLHIEKIIFLIAIVASVVVCLHLLKNLRLSLDSKSQLASLSRPRKNELHMNVYPQEAYDKLVNQIIAPEKIIASHRRDIFLKQEEMKRSKEKAGRASTSDALIADTDGDGMPNIWEEQYGLDPNSPGDANLDLDDDTYINVDEYIGGTDPTDAGSFPGILKRFEIKDIYRKKIMIRFFGYLKLPNGTYRLQINWGNKSEFKEVGDKIRGYDIIEFEQDFKERFNPMLGAKQEVDESYIRIKKGDETPITIILNRTSFEQELFILIKDKYESTVHELHAGSPIKGYEVLDINPFKVIMIKNEKVYTLYYERRGEE